MTREDAKEKVFLCVDMRAVEHYADAIVDGCWILRADVINFVDKIFDEHEAQLKAKDEEIERLCYENKKLMEHITLKNLSRPIVLCVKCSQEVLLKEKQ